MPGLSSDARTILDAIGEVRSDIAQLNRAVFTGNGDAPLLTRMALVEERIDAWLEQCRQCRAVIFPPEKKEEPNGDGSKHEDRIEELNVQKSTQVTIQKWQFAAVVVAAVLGSGLLDAIVTAIIHKP